MTRRLAALILILLTPAAHGGTIDKILGFTTNGDGVSYQVTSGGCTDKIDFELQIVESEPVQIQLLRKKPDFCEAYLPFGKIVTFSWKELGLSEGAEFVMGNPFSRQHVILF